MYPPHVNLLSHEATPKLEVPGEVGPEGDTPPGVGSTARAVSTGGDARHPHRGQHALHEKRPRTFVRKPTSFDTCFAEDDAQDGGHAAISSRSLRRLCGGSVTVRASVSMIHPNTSS